MHTKTLFYSADPSGACSFKGTVAVELQTQKLEAMQQLPLREVVEAVRDETRRAKDPDELVLFVWDCVTDLVVENKIVGLMCSAVEFENDMARSRFEPSEDWEDR